MDYYYYWNIVWHVIFTRCFMSIIVRSNKIQNRALESDMIYSRDRLMFMAADRKQSKIAWISLENTYKWTIETPFFGWQKINICNTCAILLHYFRQMRLPSPWQLYMKQNSILLEEKQLKTRFLLPSTFQWNIFYSSDTFVRTDC